MKLTNYIAIAFAAGACALHAQEAAGVRVPARMIAGAKSAEITVSAGNAKKFTFQVKGRGEAKTESMEKYQVILLTPPDLAAAIRAYNGNDMDAARKAAAACKKKYAPVSGMPGNPAHRAGMIEVSACIRLQDWEGLKTALAGFPNADDLAGTDKIAFNAAKVVYQAGSNPTGAADSVLKNADMLCKHQQTSTQAYAWSCLARALVYEAKIPAAQRAADGVIAEDMVTTANPAIDNYCRVAVSSHGVAMDLAVASLRKAQALLWNMPGVKDYAASAAPMDEAKWNTAPANFKDAVVLAYLISTVYDPEGDNASLKPAADLYFNPIQGKAKS